MRRRIGFLVACLVQVAALRAATPSSAVAQTPQGKPCAVAFTGVMRRGVLTTHTQLFTDAGGRRITYMGGGVDARCEGQGNRLLADSAEHHETRGELILINRVRYTEEKMTMDADRMVYYTTDERLFATGNVRMLSGNGTRFTGPQFEYFRAKPGFRAVPIWRAPGRPRVRMAPNDSTTRGPAAAPTVAPPAAPAIVVTPRQPTVDRPADERGDSTDLTADFIHSENDSLVWAVGKVVIERRDLRATSDSASLDRGTEFARLMREPRIVGTGERPYTLVGTRIDLWSKDQQLERVLSAGNAKVDSDSLTLAADTIDMRLRERSMERVFAWGGRATAVAETQEMEADSLDLRLPGQRLSEVHALGTAIAYSTVDTLRIESDDRDWIRGDTLVAFFDTVATADTTERTRMRDVVATGNARAFYQLAQSGGVKGPPNISYNRGRVIAVHFEEGEARQVDVKDKASGMFLEPIKADTVKADSSAKRPPVATPSTAPGTPPRRP
jgi:lipopolysaccharide export system protein LptA